MLGFLVPSHPVPELLSFFVGLVVGFPFTPRTLQRAGDLKKPTPQLTLQKIRFAARERAHFARK